MVWPFTLLVTFSLISITQSQCPSCDCFNVSTICVTLKDLELAKKLFSQAASTSSLGLGLDSVCTMFTPTSTPNNTLVELIFNYKDGRASDRYANIQQMVSPGVFQITGPELRYNDYILGSPCSGCYVIYRCSQTDCTTDPSEVDVFVVSTSRLASQYCIETGMKIAQESFPELKFYILPREKYCPCELNNSLVIPYNLFRYN